MTAAATPAIHIRIVDWDSAAAELMAVRVAVFVVEQGVPPELEQDEHDATALHLLATTAEGRTIGTARLLDDGHIGRVAVMPDWRGLGLGTRLLARLIDVAQERGLDGVFLHAQCSAESFYERLGFVAEGEVFDDAGIDHRCMRRPVSL